MDQLWYTWSTTGLGSITGHRVRAASQNLLNLHSEWYQELEKYLHYTLPEGVNPYESTTASSPYGLAYIVTLAGPCLLQRVYGGKDAYGRAGVSFIHALTNLNDITPLEAIDSWHSPFWQIHDSLPVEQIELPAVHKTQLHAGSLSVAAIMREAVNQRHYREHLEMLVNAYLTFEGWENLYLETYAEEGIHSATERNAELIWGLLHCLPPYLARQATFSTYEDRLEDSPATRIVATCFSTLEGLQHEPSHPGYVLKWAYGRDGALLLQEAGVPQDQASMKLLSAHRLQACASYAHDIVEKFLADNRQDQKTIHAFYKMTLLKRVNNLSSFLDTYQLFSTRQSHTAQLFTVDEHLATVHPYYAQKLAAQIDEDAAQSTVNHLLSLVEVDDQDDISAIEQLLQLQTLLPQEIEALLLQSTLSAEELHSLFLKHWEYLLLVIPDKAVTGYCIEHFLLCKLDLSILKAAGTGALLDTITRNNRCYADDQKRARDWLHIRTTLFSGANNHARELVTNESELHALAGAIANLQLQKDIDYWECLLKYLIPVIWDDEDIASVLTILAPVSLFAVKTDSVIVDFIENLSIYAAQAEQVKNNSRRLLLYMQHAIANVLYQEDKDYNIKSHEVLPRIFHLLLQYSDKKTIDELNNKQRWHIRDWKIWKMYRTGAYPAGSGGLKQFFSRSKETVKIPAIRPDVLPSRRSQLQAPVASVGLVNVLKQPPVTSIAPARAYTDTSVAHIAPAPKYRAPQGSHVSFPLSQEDKQSLSDQPGIIHEP
ncbi:GAP1-N2 domain-containing protein [Dictyobacter arantiisoli]|uniref:Uncharacterized protein n=1 Tax=Dictyobacter arantiisoli TaxID=2014874 RepID=A0A5A5TBC6_9CHLR|nr:hypothetical protein [Dictyobacter arantiisoli]GCF08698.1 hypothetical protein KDI_22620 [Dictyobacter arantiisoli]